MTEPFHKVMVMGAGGMGALFGAILSDGGLDVVLVDNDREHVEAIRKDGLHISGLGGDRYQQISAVYEASAVADPDLVLVQCKGTASADAARAMAHLKGTDTIFISFQNGLGNEDTLASHFGVENVFGGLTSMAGARLGPGHIQDFDRVPSCIGEWSGGLSERAGTIAAAFTAAGLETNASANIKTEIWKKLLGNMTMSAVSGITNLTSAEILQIDALRKVCFAALDEAILIAHSEGVMLEKSAVVKGLEMMTAPGGTGDNKSSLCLDVLAKRQSEVEFIYGKPLELAEKAGLVVPTIRTLYGLVKGIETHYVKERRHDKTI